MLGTSNFDFDVLALPTNGASLINFHELRAEVRLRPAVRRSQASAEIQGSRPESAADEAANALPISMRDNWSRIALSKLSLQSYSKLIRMAQRPDGWRGLGSLGLQTYALRYFLEFWQVARPDAFEPSITLTAAGGIEAEWYKNSRRYLTVRFGTKPVAAYGLFDRNHVHEGMDVTATLVTFLKAHPAQPLKWM
jgi:hypothetical protein